MLYTTNKIHSTVYNDFDAQQQLEGLVQSDCLYFTQQLTPLNLMWQHSLAKNRQNVKIYMSITCQVFDIQGVLELVSQTVSGNSTIQITEKKNYVDRLKLTE